MIGLVAASLVAEESLIEAVVLLLPLHHANGAIVRIAAGILHDLRHSDEWDAHMLKERAPVPPTH
jgi:hypothetical protein